MAGGGVGEALLIGSLAAGAAGQAYGGFLQYQGAKSEQEQLKVAEDRERLAGKQRALEIRENMNRALAAQNALFAGRGVGASGVTRSIADRTTRDANIDLNVNSLNTLQAARGLKLQRGQSSLAGRASLISGLGNAASAGITAKQVL